MFVPIKSEDMIEHVLMNANETLCKVWYLYITYIQKSDDLLWQTLFQGTGPSAFSREQNWVLTNSGCSSMWLASKVRLSPHLDDHSH